MIDMFWKVTKETIIHMLGYLDVDVFVDAFTSFGIPKDELLELLKEMDYRYSMDMREKFQEMIKDD